MAILKDGSDEYEVRIKRYPDGTYFDEYIKLGDREKPDATKCDRYIVGEAGVTYTIEVTLKAGFYFGKYAGVIARLFLGAQTDWRDSIAFISMKRPKGHEYKATTRDISKSIEYADVELDGKTMLETRFAFRNLVADENLTKETGVAGIAPNNLGFFDVEFYKVLSSGPFMLSQEDLRPKAEPWDVQKVDERSFSKGGITYAVDFIGGRSSERKETHKTRDCTRGKKFRFSFHYHTQEFLTRAGIVKYPPPLYLYDWNQLQSYERQFALRELQRINKEHVFKEREVKIGRDHKQDRNRRGPDEPKEWCAWSRMLKREKEEAFVKLKKLNKAYENANDMGKIQHGNGDIILQDGGEEKTILNQQDGLGSQLPKDLEREAPKSQGDAKVMEVESKDESVSLESSSIKSEHIPIEMIKHEGNPTIKSDPEIKNEPSELYVHSRVRARLEGHRRPIPKDQDEELERKKAKARELAEEIEMEERLAKLKRERRALQEEIDAAERKKQKQSSIIIKLDD